MLGEVNIKKNISKKIIGITTLACVSLGLVGCVTVVEKAPNSTSLEDLSEKTEDEARDSESESEKTGDELEILNYVEEKYNKKFKVHDYREIVEVSDVYYIANELTFYEEDNEDILYKAIKEYYTDEQLKDSSDFTDEMRSKTENEIYDYYVERAYRVELEKDLDKVIKENLDAEYSLISYVGVAYSSDYIEEINPVSFKDYLDKYRDGTRLFVKLAIEVESKEDIENYYDAIHDIHKELKDYKVDPPNMEVYFVLDAHSDEIKEDVMYNDALQVFWEESKNTLSYISLDSEDKYPNYDLIEVN